MKYDIFISYRREGGFETANLIASKLKLSGYRVFLDIHSMHSGDFSEQLKEKVKRCKDFVWVLSPTSVKNDDGTVTRVDTLSFRDGVDYFRDEICWAIEYHKIIIPVILDGFIVPKEFPKIIKDTMSASNPSCNLHQLQAVEASKNQHFDASISELKRYLHSHPIIKWRIVLGSLLTILACIYVAVTLFQPQQVTNCTIKIKEAQKHSFSFDGGDIQLFVDGINMGTKHVYSLSDEIVFTDIDSKSFGEEAIIMFKAIHYREQQDTIKLAPNIDICIFRDETYQTYWGVVLDEKSGTPLSGVRIRIGNKNSETDIDGQYRIDFPIEEQSRFKSFSASKQGYETFIDNEIHPGSENQIMLSPKLR